MKTYMIIVCILIYVFLVSRSVLAAAIEIELSHFAKASHLINQGRFKQASEQWHRLSIIFLSAEMRLGTKHMWQYAGLSEALAAMAANKANDVMAYQYWADSTRYLMTGGTTWEQMQKKLHRRYEQANTQLSTQLQVADLAIGLGTKLQQELSILQTWHEELHFFRFRNPKLGLSQSGSVKSSNTAMTPDLIKHGGFQLGLGAKKLTGLDIEFNQEQHQIVPIEEENMHVELIPVNKLNLPVSSKYSIDSGPTTLESNKQIMTDVSTDTIIQVKASENGRIVVVSPIEKSQLVEKTGLIEVEGNSTSSLNNGAKVPVVLVTDGEGIILKGQLEQIEDIGVEAIHRRSFAPITHNIDSSEK